MLTSTNIAQINKALENSFAAIKRDINDVKDLISSQTEQNADLRKQLENAKTDFVTKDKLNVLKIKIGEINQGLNKIWDIEKQIKSSGGSKALQQAVDELNSRLIAMSVKLNELNKTSVSETQLKVLTDEINKELNNIAAALSETETRKDELRRDDIKKYNEYLIKKIEDVSEEVKKLRKTEAEENKKFVTESEIKNTLNSINREFDSLAESIEDLKKENKDNVKSAQVKGLIDDISDEFDSVKKNLSYLNNKKEAAATKKEFEGLVDEFSRLEKNVDKLERNALTKDYFARELRQIDKDLESLEKPQQKVIVNAKMPAKEVRTDHKGKSLIGNIIVVIAFILLGGSIYSYYIGEQLLMDQFAIGAVIIFIIGMALRVYSVLKSSR